MTGIFYFGNSLIGVKCSSNRTEISGGMIEIENLLLGMMVEKLPV